MTIPSAAALFGTMVVLSLAPGPIEVVLVARSTTHGPASGAVMIAGIVFADFLLIAATFSGLAAAAAALGSLPSAAIGSAGVFLLYLGIAQIRRSASAGEVSPAQQQLASFSTGLFLTLGDPKALLGYAALLPAFVEPSTAPIEDAFAVFLLAAAAISLAKGIYVALADRAASLLLRSRAWRTLNRVAGGALICTGIYLVSRAFARVAG